MRKTHYSLDSEYDKAWCGADVMQGGENNIYSANEHYCAILQYLKSSGPPGF